MLLAEAGFELEGPAPAAQGHPCSQDDFQIPSLGCVYGKEKKNKKLK